VAPFTHSVELQATETFEYGATRSADMMEAFAVSTAVNSPGRDAPEMAEPLR
jgi:hypothetical protein